MSRLWFDTYNDGSSYPSVVNAVMSGGEVNFGSLINGDDTQLIKVAWINFVYVPAGASIFTINDGSGSLIGYISTTASSANVTYQFPSFTSAGLKISNSLNVGNISVAYFRE